MNISVFGLGYVGSVTAACLASQGHKVLGVDVNLDKVEVINSGRSPVVEPELDQLIRVAVNRGNLSVTQDAYTAVSHGDVCLICVGTPSNSNGSLNLKHVERVCTQIGWALSKEKAYKVVTLRSTILPGIFNTRLVPILSQESGKRVGKDFGFVINPEFLREGSGVQDFENPPFTLIGEFDNRSGDFLAGLYEKIPAPIFRTDPDTACLVKYASNAFHALKVTYANEIGRLCKEIGLDSTQVMEIFCQDTKLNVSSRYLRPGFAFGGSCLPKDLRALLYLARHSDANLPVLESVLPSNALHIQQATEAIIQTDKKYIAVIGLSFKPHTDDLRESPIVHLTESLIGKGFEVRIYDTLVNTSQLIGSNRAYIEQTIPHLAALMCGSLEETVKGAEVIIAGHGITDELADLVRNDQILIDLERVCADGQMEVTQTYQGIRL